MDLESAATESIKLSMLGRVAKAALEAGLEDEARTYANQALTLASEPRYKNAAPNTFASMSEGDAVFLGNLILGRLAPLEDDVPAAEKYLLFPGQITSGQPVFWGPNMTLARELLKRNRAIVVLQFLQEVKHFWRADSADSQTVDKWAEMISTGTLPDRHLIY